MPPRFGEESKREEMAGEPADLTRGNMAQPARAGIDPNQTVEIIFFPSRAGHSRQPGKCLFLAQSC